MSMSNSTLFLTPLFLVALVTGCTSASDGGAAADSELHRPPSRSWRGHDSGQLLQDAGPPTQDAGPPAVDSGTSIGALLWSQSFESSSLPSAWSESASYGGLDVFYAGFGTVGVVNDGSSRALQLSPMVSTSAGETHAALVRTTVTYGDMDATVTMQTAAQLRRGSPPNTWEVGWVLWHMTDDNHFYSFVLKENGWELGKEDPAYPGAQRYLATSETVHFDPFVPHVVHVVMRGNTMSVDVDGVHIVSATDTERPYASGSLAFYTEDATVWFDDASISTPAP